MASRADLQAAAVFGHSSDPDVEEAQRDFYDAEASWVLKPKEKICASCWLVQPCDCEGEVP